MNQTELRVIPVKPTVVSRLITDLPAGDVSKAMLQAGQASMKLLEYCIGWGVVDNPPERPIDPRTIKYEEGDAVPNTNEDSSIMVEYYTALDVWADTQELIELLDAETEKDKRVVWVSHIVCKNSRDTQLLMERVLEISK